MSFATKFNTTSNQFTYQCQSNDYKTLNDLSQTEPTRLRGLFINKSKGYKDHPVAVCDNFYVDLPSHLTDNVNAIIADQDAVADINNCNVGFVSVPYVKKTDPHKGETFYTVKWVDLEPES